MAEYFSKVLSGTTRPVATTLSAQKLSGATSFTVTAATGWDTGTKVHGIMYRTDAGTGAKVPGSQIDWKGNISGTTVSNVTITAGTDDTYAIGTTVELAPTAAWGDDMATGILVEHNQDGTHGAVTASSVTVASGKITTTAVSKLEDAGTPLSTYRANYLYDFVYSGGVWSGDSYGSTRNASMTAMVCYINGRRISISAVTARSFTASKDTYIDVLDNADGTGTLVYTEVANNAASPALAANSIRLGIIVTGAGSIANVGSVNQGQEDKVLPIASSIAYTTTDSLGNLICPRDPNRRILGYRRITSTFSTASGTDTQVTGLSVPVIVPTGRTARISVFSQGTANSSAGAYAISTLWRGAVATTQISASWNLNPTATREINLSMSAIDSTGGSLTYNVGLQTGGVGTASIEATSTSPAYVMVELM